MWTRELLKRNAKQVLSRTFTISFLVSLAFSALSQEYTVSYTTTYSFTGADVPDSILSTFILGGTLGSILSALFAAFFVNPLIVGQHRYFMEARLGNAPFSSLFGAFHKGEYKNIVAAQFFTNLEIALYTLLLIIPGIIKSYEYALVPYLLAENPNLPASRVKELSREIMQGEKFPLFVLQLSFFGWMLLIALLPFFLSGIWLLAWLLSIVLNAVLGAYMSSTMAEFYAAMREKAFSRMYSNPSELGGFITY